MFDFLNFLRQKYGEYNNNPIRQGTIVDELAVKPTGLLMADFYNTQVEKEQRDNIDNYAIMTEEQMDAFGNKFFFPRVTGSKAFGVIRIWVDQATDVSISTTFNAVSNDNLLFPAISNRIISASSMIVSNDSYGKYYFDVAIQAAFAGEAYNKLANEIQSIVGVDFVYKFATNLKDLTPGSTHENNTQYYSRLKYSLNDRSLANKRSLYAGLKDRFPFVYSLYAAGAGDKYMIRDRLQAIDLSNPPKEAKFLGKIAGDNIVKHTAYFQQFPTEAGNRGSAFAGPFSIYSKYSYPQTIDAVDMENSDPAYHGYALYQEADDTMYRGLYYDDFRNFMEVTTNDLLNITEEIINPGTILLPNEDWIAGSHGRNNGDYGLDSTSTLGKIDIISFNGNQIIFKGGTGKPVTVGKDIKKRIGIKVSGTIKLPTFTDTANNTAVQFILGAPEVLDATGSTVIDSYSGIGFGIFVYSALDSVNTSVNNATVFFSNSERHDSVYVFKSSSDVTFGALGSIAETGARFQFGRTYSFEFVIYDNLALGVKILPAEDTLDNDGFNNDAAWILESTVLNVYKNQILSLDSSKYGSILKVTMDSQSTVNTDEWTISNLKAVDLAPHRPTALYIFNVDGLEEPLSLTFRGTGIGAVNNANQAGHSVYIWNLEAQGPVSGNTILSSGGWQILDSVSDPAGIKDVISASLTQQLTGIDKYRVLTRFGNVIIFMVVAEGTSRASLTIENDTVGDINANLMIDYIKLQDVQTDVYHGNNKCDLYVSTLKNADNVLSVTTSIIRDPSDSYFLINKTNGFTMPIISIDSIVDTTTGIPLSSTDYTIVRDNNYYINSSLDEFKIVAPNNTEITVSYSVYNNIVTIQDFFDGQEYGKIFGNVLIKHKFPVYLDFELIYGGTNTSDIVVNAITTYFDDNVDRIFTVNDMITYLFNNGFVNNVQQPITVTYTHLTETGLVETGTFTDSYTAREIDFYRLRNIVATKL